VIAPEIIAHADWGVHPRKRQLAVARLMRTAHGGAEQYEVVSLAPTPGDMLGVLTRTAARQTLVGFDFPIGLPRGIRACRRHLALPGFSR
jgi:hypothetical protein